MNPEEVAEQEIARAHDNGAVALHLAGIGLSRLPRSIKSLRRLLYLDLSGNKLRTIPSTIGALPSLRSLVLARNSLTELPDAIGDLVRLQILDISSNRIKHLPDSLALLSRLRVLDASDNALRYLPDWLFRLTKMQATRLHDFERDRLPEYVVEGHGTLQQLYLHNNPGLAIPVEVLGPTRSEVQMNLRKPESPNTILRFHFSSQKACQPLNEVRLLLVGRGGAGKTSIARRLIENRFRLREKDTKGIDIRTWELRCGTDTMRAHVWDFAGQVITHATHQFFLSHRSVYVLVLTGREDSERLDAEYWLRIIRAFGTEQTSARTSPVIVALNKWASVRCNVDRNALQEKYPFIVGFVQTDCYSGLGISDLNTLILKTVDGMDSVRESFPRAWFAIKEMLATMKVDYMTYAEFRKLCEASDVRDPQAQNTLAQVLHVLGVALNYADDKRLREATVLNPHWVTKGIYTLLREAASTQGTLSMSDVERVLPQEKPEMRRYLIELMRRFDLAFPLSETGDEWLVPQGLPPDQPRLSHEWQGSDLTRLRYTYAALPEGLVPRFITRTYPLSEGQERWLNGVVLVMDDARALVRADPSDRCVMALVKGSPDGRRRLAGLVREDLRRIHADIRGLDPLEEMEMEGNPGKWLRMKALEADERGERASAAVTSEGTVSVDNTKELNRVSLPAARDPSKRKGKVFISYSSRDARQHDELTVRLKPLRSEGLVEIWSDRCLVAGEDWDKTIRRELEEADVIVLLWSAQFEASDYVRGVEIQRAVERAKAGEAVVVSIILEKCGWDRTPLASYQVLPRNGRPVRSTQPQRDAWYEVQEALRRVLRESCAKPIG